MGRILPSVAVLAAASVAVGVSFPPSSDAASGRTRQADARAARPVSGVKIEAEAYATQRGVGLQDTADTGGGSNVAWIGDGDRMTYRGIRFKRRAARLALRVASGAPTTGFVHVRLNGPGGRLVGRVRVAGTGGWQEWRTRWVALRRVRPGRRAITLVFRSASPGDFVNVNWLRLRTARPTRSTPSPEPAKKRRPAPSSGTPQVRRPPGTPGPRNTGVPAGTPLTRSGVPRADGSGVIVLSSPGAVYDSKVFNGRVEVNATGVTISRSLIRGQVSVASTASLRITDSEITGEFIRPVCDTGSWRDAAKVTGLGMTNVTGLRLNIHHFGKGIMTTGNFTLRDSWIHDFITGNCDAGGANTHTDGVFVWPGSNNVFTGNFIDAADSYRDGQDTRGNMTAAIFLYHGDVEVHANDVFSGNRMSGGSYTVYAGDRLASNVDWTGNVFVRSSSYPNGGIWGPVTGYFRTNGNDWTNNTWADTGDAISR